MILILRNYVSVQAGPPSTPEIKAITKDSVTLAWEKPSDDGGGKILGYIIEKKPDGGDWEEVNPDSPVKELQAIVPKLTEGKKYQFRVKAVNAAGPGRESRPTENVTVETQPEIVF